MFIKQLRRVYRVLARYARVGIAACELNSSQKNAANPVPGQFEIGIYYADSDENIYQMRQWYEPFRELDKRHPVVIITRNAAGAKLLRAESQLAVLYLPRVLQIEKLLQEHPLPIICYVNQNISNFQMLRYGNRYHVYLNHGESDKVYMLSNQQKAYDYCFIAGKAAAERLAGGLRNFDVDKRTIKIGRPQLDYVQGDPPYLPDGRSTVLYAPTWEGDRPSASYSSVLSHGVALVQGLLAAGHRVVYRPHPRTGIIDVRYRLADKKIRDLLRTANKSVQPGHIVDTAAALNWQLSAPDFVICDISAMIYDLLATGKAVAVTAPSASAASVKKHGFLTECLWISEAEAASFGSRIPAVLLDSDYEERCKSWAKYYFGDVSKGAASKRFTTAVEKLLRQHDELSAEGK